MSVNRRGNSDVFHYEFQYKGNRYRGTTGLTSKRKAQQFEENLKRQIRERVNLDVREDMTWGEAIDRYWDTVIFPKGNKEAAKNYLGVLIRLRSEIGENRPLVELTRSFLADYRDRLLSGEQRGRKLKPSAVNRQLDDVRAILNRAADDWGVLIKAPKIKQLPTDNKRDRRLSEDEEKLLLSKAPPHIHDFIIFCIDTGARKGEAVGLLWKDVELGQGDRGVVKFMDTKSKQPRGIPLTKRVHALLTEKLKDKPEDVEHVFVYQGKPAGDPKKAFEQAVKDAALFLPEGHKDNVTPHVLRHTFASRLVMKGVPLYQVSKLMGHASMRMTERYAHLAPKALENAIAALD
jgi:integrase